MCVTNCEHFASNIRLLLTDSFAVVNISGGLLFLFIFPSFQVVIQCFACRLSLLHKPFPRPILWYFWILETLQALLMNSCHGFRRYSRVQYYYSLSFCHYFLSRLLFLLNMVWTIWTRPKNLCAKDDRRVPAVKLRVDIRRIAQCNINFAMQHQLDQF